MTDIADVTIKVDSKDVKRASTDLVTFAGASGKADTATKSLVKTAAGYATFAAVSMVVLKAASAHRVYSAALSDLSAITGAVGQDLEFYNEQAREIGATTTLSATQAVEAFKLIASAKPDLLASRDALAAVTRETVTLAEASGLTMPDAARALGSSLNQFGADADKASDFINVLAAGAKFGASEINNTSQALKIAGTVAHNSGLSFEETNAAIQAMAGSALVGSEAGTGLRGVLLKLATQSRDEFNPEIVGLSAAIQNLGDASLSTAEKKKLFGQESITAANALIAQADSLDGLIEKLTGTNTAYEQASIRTNNLDGDIKRLASAYEEAALTLGDELDPALRGITQLATDLAKPITVLILEFADLGNAIGAYMAIAAAAASFDLDAVSTIIDARKQEREELDKTLEKIWGEGSARKDATTATGEQEAAIIAATEAKKEEEKVSTENFDSIMDMIAALHEENQALGESERATALRHATQLGATVAQLAAINATYDIIEAYNAEQAAIDSANKEKAKQEGIDARVAQSKERASDAVNKEIKFLKIQTALVKNGVDVTQARMKAEQAINKERLRGLGIDEERINQLMALQNANSNILNQTEAQTEAESNHMTATEGLMSAMQTLSQEGSEAYMAVAIAQSLVAIAKQASEGDVWSAFARTAAMAGMMQSYGLGSGGSGGGGASSGTTGADSNEGTVFGDPSADNETMVNSLEIIATATDALVGINRDMLAAMTGAETATAGYAADLSRTLETLPNLINAGRFGTAGRGGTLGDPTDITLGEAAAGGGTFAAPGEAQIYQSLIDSINAGAETLGVSSDEMAARVNDYVLATTEIPSGTAEEMQAALDALYGEAMDNLVAETMPWLVELQDAGEGLGETMFRVATNVQVTEDAIDRLGLSFQELDASGMAEASTYLIDAAGGVDQFTSSMASFVDNFYTEEQQFELLSNDLNSAMTQAGLALPDTRQGFVDLLQAQDAATESGADNIATILRLEGVANEYYSTLDSLAAGSLINLQGATDSAMTELQRSVDTRKSELNESLSKEVASIKAQADQRAKAQQAAAAASAAASKVAFDAAKAGLKSLTDELKGITSAADSLRDSFEPVSSMGRDAAINLLKTAQATGDLAGAGEAAQTAAAIDAAGFGSLTDLQREQGQTLALLESLELDGGEQLSAAERTVDALQGATKAITSSSGASSAWAERQIDEATARHEKEVEELDGLLAEGQEQINLLRGIETGILDIPTAINTLSTAIGMEAGPTDRSKAVGQTIKVGASRVASNDSGTIVAINRLDASIKEGNRVIAKNTMKTAKSLDRWDGDGMPDARGY